MKTATSRQGSGWRLLSAVFLLCAVGSAARAQSGANFDALRADLLKAAETNLEQIRNKARAAETKAIPQDTLALSGPTLSRGPALGDSLGQIRRAHERFRAIGADASRIFTEEGVPLEILLVGQVESAFDPEALSPKGAKGVWQLMPATAARFGLRVDERVDQRTDAIRATRAAARYLKELHTRFGDWLLVLAAYNAGESRVATAIARGGTRDFWELARLGLLPSETRVYVPAVLRAMRGRTPPEPQQ